jgi:hypothetical protein
MNTNDIPTSVVLNRAADLIEQRGWNIGEWYRGDDSAPLCTEGAIQAAIGTTDFIYAGNCPAYQAVADYLGQRNLFIWNDRLPHAWRYPEDAPERKWKGFVGGSRESAMEHGRLTVIATLRSAALIEAAKENAEAREQVAR